jgi:subfamily B ATP-binding cassette protein HlyB/CyaB
MTASLSSKLRLLLDSAPLSNVDPGVLASHEDAIPAWQLDVGQELATEGVPLAHVVLVVDGTLRVSGRDSMGNPFTLRRVHAGEWYGLWGSLSGVSSATCRTTEPTRLLAVPAGIFQQWFTSSSELATWLESHPQREDLYASLRPLLV